MRILGRLVLAVGACTAATLPYDAAAATQVSDRSRTPAVPGRALPALFEANRGQGPEGWDFTIRCRGYHAFVRSGEALFSFDGAPLSVALEGRREAAPDAREISGRANYLLGADPARWVTGVPLADEVAYRSAAPGTTWRVGSRDRRLEFSLVVAAGAADPRLCIAGSSSVRITDAGELSVPMPAGEATISAPIAWQDADGGRRPVDVRWALEADGALRLALGPRDGSLATTVDPTVSYLSYLGGSGQDDGAAAAVDGSGDVYLGGNTYSTDFPTTTGAYATSHGANSLTDAFVVKLASGSSLAYATFFGTTGEDTLRTLAADAAGNAYFTGGTGKQIPTTAGVVHPTYQATGGLQHYAAKLDPEGDALVWATYTRTGPIADLSVTPSGDPYLLTGDEVVRLAADATSIQWTKRLTPLSQSVASELFAICATRFGEIFVAAKSGFPGIAATSGAYMTTNRTTTDAALVHLDTSGSVVWCTLFGGTGTEEGLGVGADAAGRPFLAGRTSSSDLPTGGGSFQASILGSSDLFLARFSADGTTLRDCTYYGGAGTDEVLRVLRVHASGAAFLGGYVGTSGVPSVSPFQASHAGGLDGFLAKFRPSGAADWSSHAGGSGDDGVTDLALGPDGTLAAALFTGSSNLATSGAYQSSAPALTNAAYLEIPDSLVAQTPSIAFSELAPTTVGVPYAEDLAASGGTGPYAWTIHSGALPAGVSLSSGRISGTPTATGSFPLDLRVADADGLRDARAVTLLVNPAPQVTTPSLPGRTAGIPFAVALEASGGTGTLEFDLASGALPQGVTLDADGTLSGTPSTPVVATFEVGVRDTVGATAKRAFTLTVNPPVAFASQTLPDWTEGRPFASPVATVGGTPPLAWTVVSGSLPAGGLDAVEGRFTGPALAAGEYDLTLRVVDACGSSAERAFRQVIRAAPQILPFALGPAAVGRPYVAHLSATGGTAPAQWDVLRGVLPTGLGVGAASGTIAGTPAAAGEFGGTFSYTDAAGAAASADFAIPCAAPVALASRSSRETVVVDAAAAAPIHRYVELTAGCVLTVQVAGGGVRRTGPTLRLVAADGAEVPLGTSLRGNSRGVQIRGFAAPHTGRYFLAVTPATGFDGKVRVGISVAARSRWSSVVAADGAGDPYETSFSAPPGATRLTVTVAPARRSAARPRILDVTGPDGASVVGTGVVRTKGRSVVFSAPGPLGGGDHRVLVGTDEGTAGDVSVTASFRAPKTYDFELSDVPAGE